MLSNNLRTRSNNPRLAVLATAILLIFPASALMAAGPAAPGVASSTGASLKSNPNQSGKSFGAPNSAAADSMSSNSTSSTKETVYSTDENTDLLERAIERFNRERCPPDSPIREIDRRNLTLLAEFRYIPSDISKFEKMVIRGGKIFKPVDQKPGDKPSPYDIPSGKVPDSLSDVIDGLAEGLSENSPKGSGTPAPSKQIQVEERRATFRNQNGELVEFKYFVPRVPVKSTRIIKGKLIKAPVDMVKKDFLPAKYKTPISMTETAPAKQ